MSSTDSATLPTIKFELLDPDVRLMLQVKADDAAAFEALVSKYQHRLIMVLNNLVNDRAMAEDLAQDVFLRVYRARKSYVPTAKFSTWLYRITHNVANNALRSAGRRKEVHIASSPSGSITTRPLDSMAQDKSGLMPTRQFDQKEIRQVLHQAIQNLPARQRMAMMLSRFENMSYQEIADTMQLKTQAVKSLLSRARVNLKSALEPYVELGQLPNANLRQHQQDADLDEPTGGGEDE